MNVKILFKCMPNLFWVDLLGSSICSTGTVFGTGHFPLYPGSVEGDSAVHPVVSLLQHTCHHHDIKLLTPT